MIPKIIHYCWLSNDSYPEKVQFCISSWKRNLPDYKIVLWDLNKFNIDTTKWTRQAFDAKKYAFAADYIRCYALYNYGGIYLDSDVEVLKTFNELLDLPYFIGQDCSKAIEAAVVGCEKGNFLYKNMLSYYESRDFIKNDGRYDIKAMPDIMDEVASSLYEFKVINKKEDFEFNENILNLFTSDYFSPKRQNDFKINLSDKTFSIHHFNASWYPPKKKLFRKISQLIGFEIASKFSKIVKSACGKE